MTSKTVTIQYKPVTSLAGNNNTLAHYEQSRGFDQISHALSNIHGLCGCSCNLFDVVSVHSLNLGKLPGCFSYKQPWYEASPDLDIGPDFVYLDSYKRVSSVCTVVLAQIYYHSAILLSKELTWPIAVWNIKFTQILHNSCRPLCNYDVWGVEYETMVVR